MDDDLPEAVPDVLLVVEPDVLALDDLEALALVVDDLEVVPLDLLLFELELPEALGVLLPKDVLVDVDDVGVLDDPPERFDDWFEL
ncbi:MAG: hypothetical protein LPK03_14760 [Pontibacter sp.]|nr:hypothetical protein [Pontibacter sp.]